MSAWDNLSIREKAAMMRTAVSNGITNIDDIRREYNEFAQGGNIYAMGTPLTEEQRRALARQYFWENKMDKAQQYAVPSIYEGGNLPEVAVTAERLPFEYQNVAPTDNTFVAGTGRPQNPQAMQRAIQGGEQLNAWHENHPVLSTIGTVAGAAPLAVASYPFASYPIAALGDAAYAVGATPLIMEGMNVPFVASGLNNLAHGNADWQTALEIAPLAGYAKPVWNAGKAVYNTSKEIVPKAARFMNSPVTGKWTQFGNREYRLSPNSLGTSGLPIESRNITSSATKSVTSQMNKAYEEAVKRGDRKTALKLLDEAYKMSGVPKTDITIDAQGYPQVWYTGSQWGNHTVFDSSKMNATIGGESAAGKVKGNFLTTDLPSATRYAGSDMKEVKEMTEPTTFFEKLQNLLGQYKPQRIHPADRIPEKLKPKPSRLFTTKEGPVVSYLDDTDQVVYPMYVNPGERVFTVDFRGAPWSKSPVEFPNAFRVSKNIRDDVAKTYRDEIVPFKDKETAIEYYKSLKDRFGKANVEDPAKLNEKYFPYAGGDRSVKMYSSAPTYESARLIETHVPNTTNGAVQTAAREGYTSVHMPNVIDSNSTIPYAIDDFVTLNSNQMKIADITYDDAGNLIPLSDRFNWSNLDTRWGLVPTLGIGAMGTLYNQKAFGGKLYDDGGEKQSLHPNVGKAMQYFMNKGLTDYQAAGLVGNLMRESSLDYKAVNKGSNAYGLAQWLGDRKTGLFKKYGNNPTFEQQLDYVWDELNSTHKNGLRMLKASKSAEEAARNAMGYYEFSAGPEKAIANMIKHGQDGEGSMRKGVNFAMGIVGQNPVEYVPQMQLPPNYNVLQNWELPAPQYTLDELTASGTMMPAKELPLTTRIPSSGERPNALLDLLAQYQYLDSLLSQ